MIDGSFLMCFIITDDVLIDILLDNFFLLSYNDHIEKTKEGHTYAAEK